MDKSATHLAAFLPSVGAGLIVRERGTPAPKSDELWIRIHVIALTPKYWKRQPWGFATPSFPIISGSGRRAFVVEKIGSDVPNFKRCNRVFAYADAFQSAENDHAAFQAYTIVKAVSPSHLPEHLSFKDNALIPMGAGTSSIALFDVLELPKPNTKLSSLSLITQLMFILVWGDASSVGSMAIQLARLTGIIDFAIVSTHHYGYLRSLGATEVIVYRSETVLDKLISATQALSKPIYYALDAVLVEGTLQAVAQVLSTSSEVSDNIRQIAHLLPRPESLTVPEGFEMLQVSGGDIWERRLDLCS